MERESIQSISCLRVNLLIVKLVQVNYKHSHRVEAAESSISCSVYHVVDSNCCKYQHQGDGH